ncbi:MAG: GTPase, partial [Thermoleophilia bacterium]
MTRSGFVALAGRPNVGKSTLVNSMVGHKVAIVSDKPQTTRRAIRGVITAPERFQLVLTDLPGVQRPRDALTERMQHRVESELSEADAALFVVNGEQGVGGPGDVFIAEALSGATVPVVVAVNKVDRPDARAQEVINEVFDLFAALDATDEQLDFPILYGSGRDGWMADSPEADPSVGLEPLFDLVLKHVPQAKTEEGPFRMLGTLLEANPFLG